MTSWLTFWNKSTFDRTKDRLDGKALSSSYVPHALGKVARGDTIYTVSVRDFELVLITRMIVDKLDLREPNKDTLDVFPASNRGVKCSFRRAVPNDIVAKLTYLESGGAAKHFPLDSKGRPLGDRFQGRASLRELVEGADLLDGLLPERELADAEASLGWELSEVRKQIDSLLGEIGVSWTRNDDGHWYLEKHNIYLYADKAHQLIRVVGSSAVELDESADNAGLLRWALTQNLVGSPGASFALIEGDGEPDTLVVGSTVASLDADQLDLAIAGVISLDGALEAKEIAGD